MLHVCARFCLLKIGAFKCPIKEFSFFAASENPLVVEILLSRQRVRHDENGFLEPRTKRTLEVETAVRSISNLSYITYGELM